MQLDKCLGWFLCSREQSWSFLQTWLGLPLRHPRVHYFNGEKWAGSRWTYMMCFFFPSPAPILLKPYILLCCSSSPVLYMRIQKTGSLETIVMSADINTASTLTIFPTYPSSAMAKTLILITLLQSFSFSSNSVTRLPPCKTALQIYQVI